MTAPKAATILNVVFVSNNAKITPVNANGIANMMINGILNDSNCAAITMYTSIKDRSSNILNEPNDSC